MDQSHIQPEENQPQPQRRYIWPWFLLGGVLLGILLAVLWMSKEVERMRRIRDANAPASPIHQSAPATNRP
jgi:hypothetical protein